MIDLQQFCATDKTRPYLLKPFSAGEWSWATNGHIMVRVPRRSDVPERAKHGEPDVEKVIADTAEKLQGDFVPLPKVEFPPRDEDEEECENCDGSGKAHSCPDCECKCEECGGTGLYQPYRDVSVGIGEAIYSGKYVALLQSLPGPIRIRTSPEYPAHFTFDGGEGWLMPMSGQRGTHIKVDGAKP